ncbi:MAG TPA: tetratricopeptide repeat protein [Gemmatimonadaceae bacterium]
MPLVLLAIWTLMALGQTATAGQPTAAQVKADTLYQDQDWTGAAAAYEALLQQQGGSAQVHFRLGIAYMTIRRHDDAVRHLQKAEELGVPMPQVALRLAAIHGREGRHDAAFADLKRATDVGLTAIPPQLAADAGFQRLHDDPRYEEVLAAIDRNATPCEHDPKYREFDFWLGAWDVRPAGAPPDSPPASNVITRIHGGCVLLESWTAPGQTGQSFNIYDRSRGKWHQTWVDSTGGLHEYWGELRDGNMMFTGDLPPLRGQTARRQTRLMFFKLGPDKVRQLSEGTMDGGKTWQVNYDLIYTRRSVAR